MKALFGKATVVWNEREIAGRESLIHEIPVMIKDFWYKKNPRIIMERCETPILTPCQYLRAHEQSGFNLMGYSFNILDTPDSPYNGYLRPETTVGTYEYLKLKFPQEEQLRIALPYCLWQAGISFRHEKNAETMRVSKLRLNQFWQLEFQLFASRDTKCNYIDGLIDMLTYRFGGEEEIATEDLPHYSEETRDWLINDLEIASCSIRKDWSGGKVFEVSIGLDRLIAQIGSNYNESL
jgi:hypothetical protein